MFTLFGTRLFGRIEQVDGSCVATQMFHVNFFPIVPMAGFVLLGGGAGGRALRIPLDFRSVLVGYLRWWGALASVIALIVVLFDPPSSRALAVVVLLLTVACTVAAHLAFRLSPRVKAQRRACVATSKAACGVTGSE